MALSVDEKGKAFIGTFLGGNIEKRFEHLFFAEIGEISEKIEFQKKKFQIFRSSCITPPVCMRKIVKMVA